MKFRKDVVSVRKTSRVIAGIMLAAAVAFFIYAINHPELSWPWSNTVSYIIYGIYLLVMAVLFAAPFHNKRK